MQVIRKKHEMVREPTQKILNMQWPPHLFSSKADMVENRSDSSRTKLQEDSGTQNHFHLELKYLRTETFT